MKNIILLEQIKRQQYIITPNVKNLLKLFIAVIFLKQLTWAAIIPLWQFPDEQAHFAQVAYGVEIGKRKAGPDLTKEILLSERILQVEREWSGNNRYTYHPEYNIPYSNGNNGWFEEEIRNFPMSERSILTRKESPFYPQLYYLPLVKIYQVFYNNDLFIRVFISRFVNILIYLAVIIISFRIFDLVFSNKNYVIFGVIILAFQPMFSFVNGGINSDNLFNLLVTGGIYLSLIIIRQGLKPKYLLISIIILILSVYTKPQGYLLFLIYLFPIIYQGVKIKYIRYILPLIALLFVTFPFILNKTQGRMLISDVNLGLVSKKLSIQSMLDESIRLIKHTFREVIPWYWGVFRWLSLSLPRVINKVINYILLILLFGSIVYLIKSIKNKDHSLKTISLIFFIYCSLVYYGAIAVWNYLFILFQGFSFGIQGRYFFPTISAHIGILLFGVLGFTRKLRNIKYILAIISIFMIIVHEIALFNLIFSYYSTQNIQTFFIHIGQYKPWFFKSPTNQFLIMIHIVSLIVFIRYFLKYIVSYEKTSRI